MISSTGVGDEGSDGGVNIGAESLSFDVVGSGGTGENGAVRAGEMGDRSNSSSALLSRSSSASHLRLAAFLVRFAGGEAIVAGDGSLGGEEAGGDGVEWARAPCAGWLADGLAAAATGARLRRHRRCRT
jgi:hypothetical protein